MDAQQIQALYYTARDGATMAEDGEIVGAWEALRSIRDSLLMEADRQGIELPFGTHEDEEV